MSAAPKDPMAQEGLEVSATVGFSATSAKAQLSAFHGKVDVMKSRFLRLAGITQLFMSIALIYQMNVQREHMIHDMQANGAIRLRMAQERYTNAVMEYGPQAKETQLAARELGMVRNQESVMQERVRILQEHQYMMYMGMGMSGVTQIGMLYSTWGDTNAAVAEMRATNDAQRAAKNEALMALRSGALAAAVATTPVVIAADIATLGVGVAPTAETDIGTQAELIAEQGIMSMHAGGVVRTSGFRYLEAGENVSPQKGWDRPQVYTINLKPLPGTPTREVARDFFERVGKHKGAY